MRISLIGAGDAKRLHRDRHAMAIRKHLDEEILRRAVGPDHAPDRRVVYLRGTSRNARRDREPSQSSENRRAEINEAVVREQLSKTLTSDIRTARALRGEGGAPLRKHESDPARLVPCSPPRCGSSPRRS